MQRGTSSPALLPRLQPVHRRWAGTPGTTLILVVLAMAGLAGWQSHANPVDHRAVLRTQLQLSDSELSTLSQGRPIVKSLASPMNREMATAGGVRIRGAAMMKFVDQFKTLEGFRTSQFVLQLQKFNIPPQLSDLDTLTLEAEDIESLKKCRVAACDVQLAAADIERLNREMDWKSPNAARQASELYKSILFTHLTKYQTGGRKELVQYQDREPGVHLAAETEALLDGAPSPLDQVPAFKRHLREYPTAAADADTQDFFYWSKEAFGFKPVVGLNHVSVYTDDGTGRVMIVTTQIYASHYMDGSVAINALMPDDAAGGESAFYWLYLNRSRVGRLGGLLGAISRPIVQRRARSGLMKSLLQTKQRFEAGR